MVKGVSKWQPLSANHQAPPLLIFLSMERKGGGESRRLVEPWREEMHYALNVYV